MGKAYDALFINGVFDTLLSEVAAVHMDSPEQVLYLQPAKKQIIAGLRTSPPSLVAPVKLFVSITEALDKVTYEAEIVGWKDKRQLTDDERTDIIRTLQTFQKKEGRFSSESDDGSVNLLAVRRMRRLTPPFSVSKLMKVSDGQPLSTERTRAGGWSYVTLSD